MIVIFFKVLNKKGSDFIFFNWRVLQVPFGYCYKQKKIEIALFDNGIESKLVILIERFWREYFLDNSISIREGFFLINLFLLKSKRVDKWGAKIVIKLFINDEGLNEGKYDS